MRTLGEWLIALSVTVAALLALMGAGERVLDARVVEAEAVADGPLVVVDAGHGGVDGGATGAKTGVAEAGLNLMVARLVADALSESGARVVMTRVDENALGPNKRADLAARKKIFCAEGVDLVVSIHMNHFGDSSVSGPMAYYMSGSAEGQKLAQNVIDALSDALARSRRLANPGDYFVLRECECPAVLVECGFLSNEEDEALLSAYAHQELLAEAIAGGVLAYLGAE